MSTFLMGCCRAYRHIASAFPDQYRAICGDRLEQLGEDLVLRVWQQGGTALPLLAESESRFFNRDLHVVVEFVRDGAGNVAELVVLQGTHQEHAPRAK